MEAAHYSSIFYCVSLWIIRMSVSSRPLMFSPEPHLPSIPPGVFFISNVHLQVCHLDPFPIFYVSPYRVHAFLLKSRDNSQHCYNLKLLTSIKTWESQYGNHCIHSLCFFQGLMSVPAGLYLYVFNKCLLID